ncbi:hypothetical protein [Cryptosporangium sp. NPDC048952]|uniref:hypothetical protein n=1 Tax=Cryptosporangium sp. NPDC048952 TaxID=3363961 RepID=UPI0037180AF7
MTLANASGHPLGARRVNAATPSEAGLWARTVDKVKERRRRRYVAAVKRRLRRYDPPAGR